MAAGYPSSVSMTRRCCGLHDAASLALIYAALFVLGTGETLADNATSTLVVRVAPVTGGNRRPTGSRDRLAVRSGGFSGSRFC